MVGNNGKPAAAFNVALALAYRLLMPEKDFYILLAHALFCGENVCALYRYGAVDVNAVAFKQVHIYRDLACGAVFNGDYAVIHRAVFDSLKHLGEACEKAWRSIAEQLVARGVPVRAADTLHRDGGALLYGGFVRYFGIGRYSVYLRAFRDVHDIHEQERRAFAKFLGAALLNAVYYEFLAVALEYDHVVLRLVARDVVCKLHTLYEKLEHLVVNAVYAAADFI